MIRFHYEVIGNDGKYHDIVTGFVSDTGNYTINFPDNLKEGYIKISWKPDDEGGEVKSAPQ